MRRFYLVVFAFICFFVQHLNAQNQASPKKPKPFYIAADAGASLVFLKSRNISTKTLLFNGLGYNAGIHADILVKNPDKYFSIGVQYHSLIQSVEYLLDTIYAHDMRLKLIDIPICAKYHSNPFMNATDFEVYMGLMTSLLIRAKADLKPDFDQIEKRDVSYQDNINFLNLGLLIGGGVNVPVGLSTKVHLGLSFNWGFLNQIRTGQNGVISPQYFSINSGFLF